MSSGSLRHCTVSPVSPPLHASPSQCQSRTWNQVTSKGLEQAAAVLVAVPGSDTGGSEERAGDGEDGTKPVFVAAEMHAETEDSSAAAPALEEQEEEEEEEVRCSSTEESIRRSACGTLALAVQQILHHDPACSSSSSAAVTNLRQEEPWPIWRIGRSVRLEPPCDPPACGSASSSPSAAAPAPTPPRQAAKVAKSQSDTVGYIHKKNNNDNNINNDNII